MTTFGYCPTCGSEFGPAIVRADPGKQGINGRAVGLQCTAHPEHGPDRA